MDDFLFAITAIVPMFTAVFLGYILKRVGFISSGFVKEANKLSFRVLMPVMIVKNLLETDLDTIFNLKLLIISVGGVLVISFIGALISTITTKDGAKRGVVTQCIFRTNFLLFGLAFATNLFGAEGAAPVSFLMLFIIPEFNALAVIWLSFFSPDKRTNGKLDVKALLKDIITNPLITSTLLGIVLLAISSLCSFEYPELLMKALNQISVMATPLALLALGATFTFTSAKSNLKCITVATVFRLIIVPGVMLTVAYLVGLRGAELGAVLTLFASPVAVSSYVMSVEQGCDGELAAQLVVSTTVLSAVTIFLFTYLLRAIGLF